MEQYGTANFEILKDNRNSARWVFTFLASHVNSLSTDDDIVTKTYLYFNLDYICDTKIVTGCTNESMDHCVWGMLMEHPYGILSMAH